MENSPIPILALTISIKKYNMYEYLQKSYLIKNCLFKKLQQQNFPRLRIIIKSGHLIISVYLIIQK